MALETDTLEELETRLRIESTAGDQRISEEFRDSLKRTMRERAKKRESGVSGRARFDIQLDRHECKYIIPPALVPKIREFIRPFCERDPHAKGDPPEYVITTLQMDSPWLSLHNAKVNDTPSRFKLRARIYGEPGESPVYLEVKRKIKGTIVKTRAKVPFEAWGERIIHDTRVTLPFKSENEAKGFLDFVRLAREIGAQPIVLVRYHRESYFGVMDSYARVTFDRKLEYQPTNSWDSWGRGGCWYSIDLPLLQNRGNLFSGVILELKTLSDAPQWMIDLVMHFDLERTSHCKYSMAVWQESVFSGWDEAPYRLEDLLYT